MASRTCGPSAAGTRSGESPPTRSTSEETERDAAPRPKTRRGRAPQGPAHRPRHRLGPRQDIRARTERTERAQRRLPPGVRRWTDAAVAAHTQAAGFQESVQEDLLGGEHLEAQPVPRRSQGRCRLARGGRPCARRLRGQSPRHRIPRPQAHSGGTRFQLERARGDRGARRLRQGDRRASEDRPEATGGQDRKTNAQGRGTRNLPTQWGGSRAREAGPTGGGFRATPDTAKQTSNRGINYAP